MATYDPVPSLLYFFFFFSQPFGNVKTVLSSWAIKSGPWARPSSRRLLRGGVSEAAASTPPDRPLEIQNPRPHPRPTEAESASLTRP